MATGGSTNHTIHWVAVARAAGIALTWDDIDAISQAVPLLARVYPNGDADVNRFATCGGTQFVFRELLDAGLMRSEEHTSELQSLMRISYAVFCLKKKKKRYTNIK